MSSQPRICNKTADLRGSPAPLSGEQPLAFSLESNFWYAWSATSTTTDDTTATSAAVKPFDVTTGRWVASASAEGVPLGRLVNTTAPLGGGGDLSVDRTLTFDATGFKKVVRFAFTNAATTSSTLSLPVGSYVFKCVVEITTPFSVGGTITVGQSGHATDFQGTADNNPQGTAGDLYVKEQDTAVAGAGAVLVTVGGSPAAGAGVCIVEFAVPAT